MTPLGKKNASHSLCLIFSSRASRDLMCRCCCCCCCCYSAATWRDMVATLSILDRKWQLCPTWTEIQCYPSELALPSFDIHYLFSFFFHDNVFCFSSPSTTSTTTWTTGCRGSTKAPWPGAQCTACYYPTNNAPLINFLLSSDAKKNFDYKHRLSILIGTKRAKTCMQCKHIPTELPFCTPTSVVGSPSCRLGTYCRYFSLYHPCLPRSILNQVELDSRRPLPSVPTRSYYNLGNPIYRSLDR